MTANTVFCPASSARLARFRGGWLKAIRLRQWSAAAPSSRVAAHDPVQHDEVGRRDLVRGRGEVDDLPVRTVAHARLGGEASGLVVVCRRELEGEGRSGSAPQQLDPDGAHPATDVEHRGSSEAVSRQQLDHAAGRPVQASTAVPRGGAAGEPVTEDVVAPAGVTASGHEAVSITWRSQR